MAYCEKKGQKRIKFSICKILSKFKWKVYDRITSHRLHLSWPLGYFLLPLLHQFFQPRKHCMSEILILSWLCCSCLLHVQRSYILNRRWQTNPLGSQSVYRYNFQVECCESRSQTDWLNWCCKGLLCLEQHSDLKKRSGKRESAKKTMTKNHICSCRDFSVIYNFGWTINNCVRINNSAQYISECQGHLYERF